MATSNVAIIGGGHMGAMIVRGWVEAGTLPPSSILVAEQREDRREALAGLGVHLAASAADAVGSPTILLAVTPQSFSAMADEMPDLPEATLIVSVMAGVPSRRIQSALGGLCPVVRAMPNAPCAIKEGVIGLAAGAGSTDEHLHRARALLTPIGTVIDVAESDLHAVTAVSGSGPAYVYAVAKAMIDGGVAAGLSPEIARPLAIQTLRGAAGVLKGSALPVEEMIGAIATSGGTTEAAIDAMAKGGLHEAIVNGVLAASERSRELAKEE